MAGRFDSSLLRLIICGCRCSRRLGTRGPFLTLPVSRFCRNFPLVFPSWRCRLFLHSFLLSSRLFFSPSSRRLLLLLSGPGFTSNFFFCLVASDRPFPTDLGSGPLFPSARHLLCSFLCLSFPALAGVLGYMAVCPLLRFWRVNARRLHGAACGSGVSLLFILSQDPCPPPLRRAARCLRASGRLCCDGQRSGCSGIASAALLARFATWRPTQAEVAAILSAAASSGVADIDPALALWRRHALSLPWAAVLGNLSAVPARWFGVAVLFAAPLCSCLPPLRPLDAARVAWFGPVFAKFRPQVCCCYRRLSFLACSRWLLEAAPAASGLRLEGPPFGLRACAPLPAAGPASAVTGPPTRASRVAPLPPGDHALTARLARFENLFLLLIHPALRGAGPGAILTRCCGVWVLQVFALHYCPHSHGASSHCLLSPFFPCLLVLNCWGSI